jgi:Zn-dependent M28 family amino/carboxypeptidase
VGKDAPLSAASLPNAQLSESLRRHVEMLAGLIGPRHLARPSSSAAAISYIQRELATTGDAVQLELFDAKPGTATNIILERPGTTRTHEIVILGAHHDTIPETPGADDNASAVAVLIEVAKMTAGASTARTIRFVSFANEEPPHFMTDTMGSDFHARGCHARGEKIIAMLNLEMVGYYSDQPGSQRAPHQLPAWVRRWFPRRGNFLAAVGNLKSIPLGWTFRRGFKRSVRFPLFSISLPERVNDIRLSDHSSFWDCGYPALMLTDTSYFRNPNYHRSTDTPDTLDYARMAQVTRGVAGGLLRCAICR